MHMTDPIRPEDIAARKAVVLPAEVIEVFNDLIALAYAGRSATVTQEDAVNEIATRLSISRTAVFDRNLLDIELVYQAAGWDVTYDKPGFNESYPAAFTFARRSR